MELVNTKLTKSVNNEKHADLNIEPIILFNEEKKSLKELPKISVMDKYLNVQKKLKVTNESLIRYKGKAFSVDPQYINCLVDVENKENKLYIYYQSNLLEIFDLEKYNEMVNYKAEHYTKALAQAIGNKVKYEDIEKKAIENLRNLDKLGGTINDLQ